jgi:hypothetical protein
VKVLSVFEALLTSYILQIHHHRDANPNPSVAYAMLQRNDVFSLLRIFAIFDCILNVYIRVSHSWADVLI